MGGVDRRTTEAVRQVARRVHRGRPRAARPFVLYRGADVLGGATIEESGR